MIGWKRKMKNGFTVIELMVGTVAASVLAITVSIMLFYGYLAWNRNSSFLELQRDATLSMQALTKSLRQASAAGVDLSQANQIVVSNQNTAVESSFYQQGSNLFCNPALNAGGVPFLLVRGWVISSGFTHSNIAQGVTIRLKLQNGTENLQLDGSVSFRN
jgi:type II secretory pathway pseudopilin PulG